MAQEDALFGGLTFLQDTAKNKNMIIGYHGCGLWVPALIKKSEKINQSNFKG